MRHRILRALGIFAALAWQGPAWADSCCVKSFGCETDRIEAQFDAAMAKCHHRNNAECIASATSAKASQLRAANADLRQCNRATSDRTPSRPVDTATTGKGEEFHSTEKKDLFSEGCRICQSPPAESPFPWTEKPVETPQQPPSKTESPPDEPGTLPWTEPPDRSGKPPAGERNPPIDQPAQPPPSEPDVPIIPPDRQPGGESSPPTTAPPRLPPMVPELPPEPAPSPEDIERLNISWAQEWAPAWDAMVFPIFDKQKKAMDNARRQKHSMRWTYDVIIQPNGEVKATLNDLGSRYARGDLAEKMIFRDKAKELGKALEGLKAPPFPAGTSWKELSFPIAYDNYTNHRTPSIPPMEPTAAGEIIR